MLDARALADLMQLDPTGANRLLQRVLATYQGSLERLLAQLQAAREADSLDGLRLAVHTLKSSSASVGALALSELCAKAELAVRQERREALPDLFDRLMAEAERVRQAVRDKLTDCG